MDIPANFVPIDSSNVDNHSLTLRKWDMTTDGVAAQLATNSNYLLFIQDYYNNRAVYVYQTYNWIDDLNQASQEDLDALKNRCIAFLATEQCIVDSSEFIQDEENNIRYFEIKYHDKTGVPGSHVRFMFVKDGYEYEIVCLNNEKGPPFDFRPFADSFTALSLSENIYDYDIPFPGFTVAPVLSFLIGIIVLICVPVAIILIVVFVSQSNRNKQMTVQSFYYPQQYYYPPPQTPYPPYFATTSQANPESSGIPPDNPVPDTPPRDAEDPRQNS